MEAAVKRNHLVALRGVSRQFDGPFNRLGPRISEKDFLAFRARHRPAQALGQLWHALVIKIRAGHVNEFGRLLLNRGDNLRMAVSSRADGNPRREIEEIVTVHVFHNSAMTALGHQRIVACIRRRHEFRILLQNPLGIRPGQRCHEPGRFYL